MNNIAAEIIEFVQSNYTPRKYVLWGDRKEITEQTSLRDDLKLAFETAESLMNDFFEKWEVKRNEFDLSKYFHPEYLGTSHIPDPHKPLTVGMLINAAIAGEWLYK
ncbi:DUF1493 family protein [Kosakonia sp. R1.Fl]|uniref:DUF1493 family protein n=1 Tax=Kosakonia sp. R1.Fl TaxID=2928706 RepID=UPI00201D81EF|nr:DUF1493 family protein [Kosakonia sp. R1.Fl]MCL6746882.1 DUF1493 family protein [Kosakonia sp. R1.Fl]